MNSSTGIVRRIDDLGRIVIPKEIRRILKIREGDPIEIFVTNEGVMLKKYSPIGQLRDFANEYASSLFESTDHITLITDRDTIISVAGDSRKEYLDKNVGNYVSECIINRESKLCNEGFMVEICDNVKESYGSVVISPIILYGEPIGSVILLNKDEKIKMDKMELNMAKVAASFLSKQMDA